MDLTFYLSIRENHKSIDLIKRHVYLSEKNISFYLRKISIYLSKHLRKASIYLRIYLRKISIYLSIKTSKESFYLSTYISEETIYLSIYSSEENYLSIHISSCLLLLCYPHSIYVFSTILGPSIRPQQCKIAFMK